MTIAESELTAARNAWGTGLVATSQAYEADGIDGARAAASRMLDELYGYGLGPVLFKPTMASGEQTFRTAKKGALSYFVGHDPEYPLDGGFGLKGWRAVRSKTAASFIDGDVALWMGWVEMTDKGGQATTVDKSFAYKKDADGMLRIVLHHSSLPYQP
ncbi:MAG: phosphoribosyl-AMP cyclohydrolase [bacterium]|nr:phosphoribosyl-AMP cyclohydrolase [bacterium]